MSHRACGGGGDVVIRLGFRLGGIELGRLVEVVGEGFLGGLLWFPAGIRPLWE